MRRESAANMDDFEIDFSHLLLSTPDLNKRLAKERKDVVKMVSS